MYRAIVLSVLAALSTASYAIAAEDAADTPAPPPAAEAASSGQDKKPAAKTVRQKREERKFRRKLVRAQGLHVQNRCGAAYLMYLELQAQQPQNPDVLWGLGVCGALTAQFPELGQDARRQRLLDAKAAYEAYVASEQRTQYTSGSNNRVALARERAVQLDSQIAAPSAAQAETPAASPAPAPATVAAATPPPAAVAAVAPADAATQATAPATPGEAVPPSSTSPPAEAPPPAESLPAAAPASAPVAAAAAPPPPPAAAVPADAARAEVEREHAEAQAARQRGIADALEALTAALRATPNDLGLQEQWVFMAMLAERCADVMPVYLRIAEGSKSPKVHRAGAACAEATEQPREMFLALDRYVRTSPRYEISADTYRVIAEGFVDLGERGRAKHYFEQFLARVASADPHRADAERFVQGFKRARTDCFIQRGVATAALTQVGDRWVVQVRIPPNALEQAPTCGE